MCIYLVYIPAMYTIAMMSPVYARYLVHGLHVIRMKILRWLRVEQFSQSLLCHIRSSMATGESSMPEVTKNSRIL